MNDDDDSNLMMNVNITPLNAEDGEETSRRMVSSFDPSGAVQLADPICGGPTMQSVASKHAVPIVEPKKFVWKLSEVPELTEFHQLEHRAVFVPNASPSEISARISNILHERSIQAVYDDDKAKVKCVTDEGVDFRIRFYTGRGEFSHGIIVEVQRRFGFSAVFHNETQAVLCAAQGKVPPLPAICSLPLPPFDVEDNNESENGFSALDMVAKLLRHPGCDSTFLGLQTLSSLTDSSKMGKTAARNAATSLMHLDSEVGGRILSIILDVRGDDDMFKLRTLAMTILANTMHTAELKVPQAVIEQIRPLLIQELRSANKNPRLAVQAARCVECLLPDDEYRWDLDEVLQIAHEAGMARHAGLQRQAQACLDKIC